MTSTPRVPPNQQLVRSDRWPLVGETAPRIEETPWRVSVTGAVKFPLSWSLDELTAWGLESRTIDIHCVTRWSKLDVCFEGIPLATVLAKASVQPEAQFAIFRSRSDRQHATSLPLEFARRCEALLAFRAEHRPLTTDHGGPVRLVVPGRYFYKSLKWLECIELAPMDQLGYWESEAGYHNGADPWQEQRYMAPALTRHQAAQLISARDFSGRDLRSISAAGRDLTGLNARGALLRDADFRHALLHNADFRQANLSNAHFEYADLRGADFEDADLEGANFLGADLRQARLRAVSLVGASFATVTPENVRAATARMDFTTQIDPQRLSDLTDEQRAVVESALRYGANAP